MQAIVTSPTTFQVDAVLLNTSVSSVADLGALRRVVDAAVANTVTTQPLAIQDAVAQVVTAEAVTEVVVEVVHSLHLAVSSSLPFFFLNLYLPSVLSLGPFLSVIPSIPMYSLCLSLSIH